MRPFWPLWPILQFGSFLASQDIWSIVHLGILAILFFWPSGYFGFSGPCINPASLVNLAILAILDFPTFSAISSTLANLVSAAFRQIWPFGTSCVVGPFDIFDFSVHYGHLVVMAILVILAILVKMTIFATATRQVYLAIPSILAAFATSANPAFRVIPAILALLSTLVFLSFWPFWSFWPSWLPWSFW